MITRERAILQIDLNTPRDARSTRIPAFIFAIALPWSLLLMGCDAKISQCNRLIDVINAEQDPIKQAATKVDAPGLKKLAETLDGTGKNVGGVELEDEKLRGFRDEYKTMVEDLAKVARDSAEALEAKDPNKQQSAQKKMTKFSNRETELVNSINAYCQGG